MAATTQIALLRGINLGPNNRIAMPALREQLTKAGFVNVRTLLQSGNVVADGDPEKLITALKAIIDVPTVLRDAAQLDAAIAANPFPDEAAEQPKLLQVTFRTDPVDADPELLTKLEARLTGDERVAVVNREIYSWHPDGIARSKLALALTPGTAAATARNWNTVLKIAELAHSA